jgi:general secretion pathway protein D
MFRIHEMDFQVTTRKIMKLILVLFCTLIFAGCSAHQEKAIRDSGDSSARQGVVVAKSPLSVEKLRTSLPQPGSDYSNETLLPRIEEKKGLLPPDKASESVSSRPLSNIQGTVHKKEEKPPAPPSDAPDVALNFDNADIYEVLNVFSEILGINYMVDPRVKGVVTIRTTGKVSREQLMVLFHKILELNGVTAVKKEGFYEIVPATELKRSAVISPEGNKQTALRAPGTAAIQIISLKYISSTELVGVIKPFLSEAGDVYQYPLLNTLLLVDTPDNVRRVADIVRTLDTNTFDRVHFKLYSLQNASVEDVGKELKEAFDATKLQQVLGRTVIFNFTPIPRINSVLVVSSILELFDKVGDVLKKLDSAASENEAKVYVYRVQNGRAEDILGVLQDIYGEGEGGARPAKKETKTKETYSAGTGTRTGTRTGETKTTKSPTTRYGESTASSFQTLAGEVKIACDETNNSVLIRATPRDYRSVLNTIKSLDVYPRQVVIEVLIAEITLDDTTSMGLEWAKIGAQGKGSQIGVLSNLTGETPRISTGLAYTINYTDSFVSALRGLAEENKVDVLASPTIIASNNEEAKIDISREVPIITTETTTTNTTQIGVPQTIDRSIQYRDTGIILTVTPHINDQGLVKLELNQEVSNVDETAQVKGIDSPVFSKRVATTTLTVQDGQSIIIGGLIRHDKNRLRSGVPVLSKLPVVGFLFGFHQEKITKTELMLLLTPRVIENIEEADLVTAEFRQKLGEVRKDVERKRSLP